MHNKCNVLYKLIRCVFIGKVFGPKSVSPILTCYIKEPNRETNRRILRTVPARWTKFPRENLFGKPCISQVHYCASSFLPEASMFFQSLTMLGNQVKQCLELFTLCYIKRYTISKKNKKKRKDKAIFRHEELSVDFASKILILNSPNMHLVFARIDLLYLQDRMSLQVYL